MFPTTQKPKYVQADQRYPMKSRILNDAKKTVSHKEICVLDRTHNCIDVMHQTFQMITCAMRDAPPIRQTMTSWRSFLAKT